MIKETINQELHYRYYNCKVCSFSSYHGGIKQDYYNIKKRDGRRILIELLNKIL